MALNRCELWSKGIKIASFPKNSKKSSSVWGFCPQTLIVFGWGICPQTPVCDMFELHYSLLNACPNSDILTFGSSPFPLAKSCLSPGHWPRLLIFHSTISLSYKKFLFRKTLLTSCTHFAVCPLPPLEILATSRFEILLTFICIGDANGKATESRLPEYKQKLHFISYWNALNTRFQYV